MRHIFKMILVVNVPENSIHVAMIGVFAVAFRVVIYTYIEYISM